MSNWYEPTDYQRCGWVEWLATRPVEVREVAEKYPPWKLFRLNGGKGNRVYVIAYDELEEGGVTLSVSVDPRFNLIAFARTVLGVDPSSLVACDPPAADELTGAFGE